MQILQLSLETGTLFDADLDMAAEPGAKNPPILSVLLALNCCNMQHFVNPYSPRQALCLQRREDVNLAS